MPKTPPERFEAFVGALPAVRELAFVTGRFDYHVRVACKNADDLNDTVRAIPRTAAPPRPRPASCCGPRATRRP
jgi:Lrp/AsnC family leucine-responsive transcriptional regulator